MNTNSNAYTIGYASIMVIIVAFLLAFISSSLKEKQTENVKLDTKKQILSYNKPTYTRPLNDKLGGLACITIIFLHPNLALSYLCCIFA